MNQAEMRPGTLIEMKHPAVSLSTAGRALGVITCCAFTLVCLLAAAGKTKGTFSKPTGLLG